MRDPFESYKLYNALKLHFESDSYDAFKYNFKTSVTPKSFFNRKDKYFFAKLANTYEDNLRDFYVANFIKDVKYVGDMLNEGGDRNYKENRKIKESLHRVFEVDINTLSSQDINFDKYFISEDGQHPLIIKTWMQEEISLETVVILNSILGFIPRESSKISDTIIWPDIRRKIEKYSPFVNYRRDVCIKTLKKSFT
tara:strand:- start:1137 stop:1724 length:588 start_codon:yes stop_codon:yes gene_type:complete